MDFLVASLCPLEVQPWGLGGPEIPPPPMGSTPPDVTVTGAASLWGRGK